LLCTPYSDAATGLERYNGNRLYSNRMIMHDGYWQRLAGNQATKKTKKEAEQTVNRRAEHDLFYVEV